MLDTTISYKPFSASETILMNLQSKTNYSTTPRAAKYSASVNNAVFYPQATARTASTSPG
jgi:hypothetical protein